MYYDVLLPYWTPQGRVVQMALLVKNFTFDICDMKYCMLYKMAPKDGIWQSFELTVVRQMLFIISGAHSPWMEGNLEIKPSNAGDLFLSSQMQEN